MEIVPMRDLKDTVRIENLCKENGKVFVTKNGYGRLVVMDIDFYKKTYEKLDEAKAISEGLKDVSDGKTASTEMVLENLKEKYGL